MILSVRYRNDFPVVQFQNQAHIRNPHGTGQVFKTIWAPQAAPERGTGGAPIFFLFLNRRRSRRKLPPQVGRPWRLKFFCLSFTFYRRPRRLVPKWVPEAPPQRWHQRRPPNGGTNGAQWWRHFPEGEGNPAEGR